MLFLAPLMPYYLPKATSKYHHTGDEGFNIQFEWGLKHPVHSTPHFPTTVCTPRSSRHRQQKQGLVHFLQELGDNCLLNGSRPSACVQITSCPDFIHFFLNPFLLKENNQRGTFPASFLQARLSRQSGSLVSSLQEQHLCCCVYH